MKIIINLLILLLLSSLSCVKKSEYIFPDVANLPVNRYLPNPFQMEDGSLVKSKKDIERSENTIISDMIFLDFFIEITSN